MTWSLGPSASQVHTHLIRLPLCGRLIVGSLDSVDNFFFPKQFLLEFQATPVFASCQTGSPSQRPGFFSRSDLRTSRALGGAHPQTSSPSTQF